MSEIARVVVDYAALDVSSTAVGFDSASPAINVSGSVPTLNGIEVKAALITVELDAVRWRADGTDPTSSEGHSIAAGGTLSLIDYNYQKLLKDIKFIRVTGDAKVKVTYFR